MLSRSENVVLTILNVLLEFYESFIQRVSTQKTFPNFDQLIFRLFQEVQQKELYVEITPKLKKSLLLKFKQLFKKRKTNIGKNSKCFGNYHNYGKLNHWAQIIVLNQRNCLRMLVGVQNQGTKCQSNFQLRERKSHLNLTKLQMQWKNN